MAPIPNLLACRRHPGQVCDRPLGLPLRRAGASRCGQSYWFLQALKMTEPLLARPNTVGSHSVEICDHGRVAIVNESRYAIADGDVAQAFDLALIRERFPGGTPSSRRALSLLEEQLETGDAMILGVSGRNSNYIAAYRVKAVGDRLEIIERLPVRKLTQREDASLDNVANGSKSTDSWSDEELEAAVRAYMEMRAKAFRNEPYSKVSYYRQLSEEFGRSVKAYEYRMQNISYVFSLLGRRWVPGLLPATHIGPRTAAAIERMISAIEGSPNSAKAAFDVQVHALADKATEQPAPTGNATPEKQSVQATQYVRSAEVVRWVLSNAEGVCEKCEAAAPFKRANGSPFLEVHHLWRLADGGPDTIENAIAVCPNCHRELHHGANPPQLLRELYAKIDRLEAPSLT